MKEQTSSVLEGDDIRWVITVPAVWRQPAKQFMREAAYLVSDTNDTAPSFFEAGEGGGDFASYTYTCVYSALTSIHVLSTVVFGRVRACFLLFMMSSAEQ